MKVRHIKTGVIFPDGFLNTVDHLWYCTTDQGEKTKWLEGVCEPVVEHTDPWRDVTEECETTQGLGYPNYITHHGNDIHFPTGNYRLVKERLLRAPNEGVQNITDYKPTWAFRVERKVQS